MSDDSLDSLLDRLAEEYVRRYRRGEQPSLTEYCERHPEFADDIRELFPALVILEKARSCDGVEQPDPRSEASIGEEIGGKRIGDFHILREVGRGGMGIVYEAIQESLGRHVALKILPVSVQKNARHLLRFQREARAAARLHHANIVPVYGVGESDGRHYYAMQFIRGLGLDAVAAEVRRIRQIQASIGNDLLPQKDPSAEALAEALLSGSFGVIDPKTTVLVDSERRESCDPDFTRIPAANSRSRVFADSSDTEIRLPGQSAISSSTYNESLYWDSVARIGIQVAEALQYASDEGVLHRDIKPSNLLLDLKGTVWVADFGLAKADDSDALTNTGDILGTIQYMAPERFQGHSDLRSDIYSLGATLYELVALRPMFSETDRPRLVRQILDSEPVRLGELEKRVPVDLETVILKAVAREPADRYASAAAFAEDLRLFVEGRPIRGRRVSRREQLWKWCRRNPVITGLVCVSSLLTGLLLTGLLIADAIGRERDVAIVNRVRAEAAESEAKRLLKRAEKAEQESRIRAHLAHANNYRLSGYEGQQFKCLDELRQAAALNPEGPLKNDLRDSAIAALGLTDIRPVLKQQADVLGSSCFDHQLKHFAMINLHGNKQPGTATSDGQIPGQGDFCLSVRTVHDNKEVFRQPYHPFDAVHAELDFSNDDRFLLVQYASHKGGRLVVWDMLTKELNFESPNESTEISVTATVSPNGRVLVFPLNRRELMAWDLFDRKELHRIPLKEMTSDVCFDPTGTRLAVNESESRAIVLLDLETGQEIDRLIQPSEETAAPERMSWNADGQLLAVTRGANSLCVWNISEREITSVLKGHASLITRCKFANRGNLLLTYSWDKTSKLWNASTGECLLTSERPLSTFSNNDKFIAYSHLSSLEYGICELSHETNVRTLHDPACGNETTASEKPGINWARFSADHRILAIYGNKGVALWDVRNGRQLQRLSTGQCLGVVFHPDGSELITASSVGVYRWPVLRNETDAAVRLHIGPPKKVASELNMDPHDLCWLPGSHQLAIFDSQNLQVVVLNPRLHSETKDAIVLPSLYRNVTNIAVSPDGRWLAGSGHHVPAIQMWDLHTKERVAISHGDGQADVSFYVSFSPDGRWLISSETAESTATGNYFFETGTWKRIRFRNTSVPPGVPAFSKDGRLFAAIAAPFEIMIAESDTGRTITQFRVSDERLNLPLALLGQQSVLAVAGGHDVVLWNLATISDALQELHLPWDEALRAVSEPTDPEKPIEITLDQGTMPQEVEAASRRIQATLMSAQAAELATARQFDASAAVFSEAIALAPDVAITYNNFAWMLVTRPNHNPEHAKQAAETARRAVELEPQQAAYWNTLGIAQYRNGEFRASIGSLKKAEDLQPRQWFSTNAYFIAMSHWKLGETAEANRWYAEAVKDHDANGAGDDELAAFRSETEALMQFPP